MVQTNNCMVDTAHSRSRGLKIAALAIVLSLSAACEPAPDDQFARAEAYMADADYRSAIVEVRNVLRARPDDIAARMLLGAASYQLADFATAEAAYSRALSLGHDTPDAWYGLGRTMVMQGKIRDAFERVVPNLADKSDVEAQQILVGDILFALGNKEDAQARYSKIVEQNPSSPGGLVGLAMIASANGEREKANEYIEAAKNDNPESTVVWHAAGNFLRATADFEGSIAAYDRAISVETKETPLADRFVIRMNRLSVLLDSARFAAAKTDFEDLRSLIPGHPILGFLKGRIAFGLGDFELAQSELQQYMSRVPNDLRGTAALGAVNFSQDNLRQAEFYLGQAVRANVGGEMTRRLLAETQLRLNKPEEALKALRTAESTGQSDAILLAMLGRAELGVGDTAAAIRYFEQGVTENPQNSMVGLALATTYLQAGRGSDAIELLENMEGIDDQDFRREMILMAAHLRSGATDKAVAEGDRLLRENPDDAKAYAVVGAMRMSIGDLAKAREHFDKALSIDNANIVAQYSLANMDYAAKNLDAARQGYERLLDANPTFVPGLAMLASILQKEDALEEMQSRVNVAMQEAQESVPVHVLAARLALSQKHLDEALQIISRIRETAPDETSLLHLEGLARVQKGQSERGLSSLSRAVANEPDNASYQFDLARVSRDQGDFEQAVTAIRAFQALRPDDVKSLPILVESEIGLGEPQRARPVVEAYAKRHPDNMMIRMMLGDLDVAAGNSLDALSSFEEVAANNWSRQIAFKLATARRLAGAGRATEPLQRWLQENPNDDDLRFVYAQTLEASGDLDGAVSQYESLVEQGSPNAVTLNNLAWQYAQQGRPGAIALAERAHAMAPDNGSVTDTLAWIVFQSGDVERSIPLLRQAVEQSPDNLEVRYHLASALMKGGDKEEAGEIIRNILQAGQSFPSRADAERLAKTL